MKKGWRGAVVAILALGFAHGLGSIPLCHAQEQNAVVQESPEGMSGRVQELEKEVDELRSELASLKESGKGDTSTPTPATAAAPQENAASTTQPATKSMSGSSI